MTRDIMLENAAGAIAVAEALTAEGTAATERGKMARARQLFAANAIARNLASALEVLAKEEDQ